MPTDSDPVKAYFKCSRWFGKRMPTQNWGNLLSELHVPHEQCLTGISDVFSAFFNQYLSIFIRGSLYPQQKCAYSALHLQALTECSPLDFQRSSIIKRNLVHYHLIMAGPSPDTMSYFTHQYFSLQPKHLHLFFHSLFQFCQCVIDVFIFIVLLTYCLGERKKESFSPSNVTNPAVEKALVQYLKINYKNNFCI